MEGKNKINKMTIKKITPATLIFLFKELNSLLEWENIEIVPEKEVIVKDCRVYADDLKELKAAGYKIHFD